MQATGSLRTISRSSVQLVMVAIVAATGVAFGRWVIPTADSLAPVITRSTEATATDKSADLLDRKFAQMDASDDAHAANPSAVTDDTAGTDALIDEANVAPIAPAATDKSADILNRKFAQMDAWDDAHAVTPLAVTDDTAGTDALIDQANVAPIAPAATDAIRPDLLDRKFAQMDALDDRYAAR